MNIIDENLITTEAVPFLSHNKINVYVLRLDKIHPVISGNKWYKLKFYLKEAQVQNKKTIVTFGGAYSNHIVATAASCKAYNIKSIGIIRGEEPAIHSHSLQNAASFGMKFIFTSRSSYKNKLIPDEILNDDYYIIPEGGYGNAGAAGVSTINYEKEKFDIVCCAAGTGTMTAGLINSKNKDADILAFSVLKNNTSIEEEIRQLLNDKNQPININYDFHFGGYAKQKPELIKFMNELYTETNIPTDFVYTAKLFFGVRQLINNNYFKKDQNILIIHSGGLQGNLSLRKGTLIF